MARLCGRMREGLVLWRRRGGPSFALPWPAVHAAWSEEWRAPEDWLRRFEDRVRARGAPVRRGGAYDRWDLSVHGGVFGSARASMAVEEHGAGKQLLRFRCSPQPGLVGVALAVALALLSAAAAVDEAWVAVAVIGAAAGAVAAGVVRHTGAAAAVLGNVAARLPVDDPRLAPPPADARPPQRTTREAPATVSELVDRATLARAELSELEI
jgi:hypothetical protein